MADYSNFRYSENIEDRRRIPYVPTPGTFGNGIDLGNVFDNGLLTGLRPEDFIQTGLTPLGGALGLGDIGPPDNAAPAQGPAPSYKPVGLFGGVTDNIVRAESGGNPNATNPNSSATGAGQFINSTWLDTIRTARPDLAQGKSDAELLALRTDPQLSREMTEAYANQNQAILSKNGLPVTPGSTYLAHFAGPGGAVKVLQSDPSAPVGSVLGDAVVRANPFLAKMTVADLQAWADRKMGGSTPSPKAAPATPAAPPSAPLLQIAPQTPPIFAAPPQAQPQQPQGQPGGLFESMPAEQMQAPPIFFAPRKAQDLTKLRAAFKAPVFSRG